MRDDAVFEDAAITGQNNSAFLNRDVDYVVIVIIIAIERVESQQPKNRRQFSEMYIADEFGLSQRLVAQLDDRRDIDAFKHRVNGNAIVFMQLILETDGNAVDEHRQRALEGRHRTPGRRAAGRF